MTHPERGSLLIKFLVFTGMSVIETTRGEIAPTAFYLMSKSTDPESDAPPGYKPARNHTMLCQDMLHQKARYLAGLWATGKSNRLETEPLLAEVLALSQLIEAGLQSSRSRCI